MAEVNRLRLGTYEFDIKDAWFRCITQSWSGPGWDFSFSGPCINDNIEEPLFPYGVGLSTEASPLPLQKAEDYTGVELVLNLPYDDETGEPYFGLNVWELHNVPNMRLSFVERKGNLYRIEIIATVPETIFGHPERLEMSAWTEERADHAYPV
jgi:hypothetical protein